MNLMAEHARELLGMPPEWNGYAFEAIGHTIDKKTKTLSGAKLLKVSGAVAPPLTKGDYKGDPNWKKKDKATDKTACFTPEEHEQWLKQWEEKTGKCSKCEGKGEVISSWKIGQGFKFKLCEICGGTGKAALSSSDGKED